MITEIVCFVATALVILVTVVVVRALRIRPVKVSRPPPEPHGIDLDEAIRGLQTIIRIPTVSHKDIKLVDIDKFKELRATLEKLFPNIYRVCEVNKFPTALLYHWKADKPSDIEPVLLMSHIDTVPPGDLSLWEHDPFSGDIVDGELWGRGTIDTKTTAFSLLFAIETAIRQHRTPKMDVYILIGHDEEVQGKGIFSTIDYLKEHNVHLSLTFDEGGAVYQNVPVLNSPAVFIGIAEKGYCDLKITTRGTGGHASMPPDHTALGILARAITTSEAHLYEPKVPEALSRTLDALAPHLPFSQKIICANLWLFGEIGARMCVERLPQVSPFRAMMRTTIAWTTAAAADQANVLPKEATATANLRLLAPETPETAKKRMEEVLEGQDAEVSIVSGYNPDPVSNSWGWQWDAFVETSRDVWGDNTVVAPFLLVGSTDSSCVARAGLCNHVYRLYPFSYNLKLVHNINERIPVKSAKQCIEFYVRLVRRLTADN